MYAKLASNDESPDDYDTVILNTASPEWIKAREAMLKQLEHSPKDGGTKAWCTLIGGWLALFCTFGHISSFGVYQDLYVRSGTASSSDVSWIGSVQLFFFVVMGLPAGRLVDKGHFKKIIIIGAIIYIISFFMLSLTHINHYYQLFLAQGVGMGIGSGFLYIPSMTVQGQHWQKRRAMAMGIIITGSSVGGIAYPILLNNLFKQSGFGFAVRAAAILTTGLMSISVALMSDRIEPHKDAEDTAPANVREILTDVPFILGMAIGGSFVTLGLFFPYFYLQLYTVLHGLPSTFAFYTLTIQNGASIFGRLIPNILAEKYGVMNAMLVSCFGVGVIIFSLFAVKTVSAVVIFAIFYGFFSGGVLSLFAPTVVSFVRNPKELGIRLGIAYAFNSFAFLTGPPIIGALVGDGISWTRAIVFSGTVILGGGMPFMIASRHLRAKELGTPYV